MKDIDGKVHEATLQIQQQHDQMVEKVLFFNFEDAVEYICCSFFS